MPQERGRLRRSHGESMREELARLRRENEQLRDQIDQRREHRQETMWKPTSSELKDMVPKFRPGESVHMTAERWVKTLEDLASMHRWRPNQTLHYAYVRLRGAALDWYESKRAELTEWEVFKRRILEAFPDTTDWTVTQQKMMSRQKKDSESMEDYVYYMQLLGDSIKMPTSAIIKMIVSGLTDPAIKSHVAMGECDTVAKLLVKLKEAQSVVKLEDARKHFLSNSEKKEELGKEFWKEREESWEPQEKKKKISLDEHHKEEAERSRGYNKDIVCFWCREKGHIARKCPKDNS
ncbi:uncharacterized protein LOC129803852 [Phlebotomus papatasi]|uniref:uncharacterized protein LOC129803852 n=1 Tax=Phlebotomus papatasi TaxID=29031 RepID=UPI002483B699|nr:uncharacterized protein LOC129803852 [Phlebotomus papatasi]